MIRYIERKYLCDNAPEGTRKTAAILLSLIGMGLNVLLFGIKYLAGLLCGSIAIMADAFNNLADSGSYIVALLGILLGYMKPSKRFLFGYGRIEYLSGAIISAAILLLSVRMGISSVEKIIRPETIDASPVVIAILFASLLIKGYMFLYNRRLGGKINSAGMKAAAMDSLSDCFATVSIMISIGIEKIFGLHIDGWCGVLVAVCILYAGLSSERECLAPLLGIGADQNTLKQIDAILSRYPTVSARGIALHDYGPRQKQLTMYAYIDGEPYATAIELQKEIEEELSLSAVIGLDEKEIQSQPNNHPATRQKYHQDVKKSGV